MLITSARRDIGKLWRRTINIKPAADAGEDSGTAGEPDEEHHLHFCFSIELPVTEIRELRGVSITV